MKPLRVALAPYPSWILSGTSAEIIAAARNRFLWAARIPPLAAGLVPYSKRQVAPWQAPVLAAIAHTYDCPDATLLEIGTALGYSAAVLALAAPRASVTTLNPNSLEAAAARGHLRTLPRVTVLERTSETHWDWAQLESELAYSLVFVDGNHKAAFVRLDCRWWARLAVGGTLLFHDYSAEGSERPCPTVKAVADEFGDALGRPPDIHVADLSGVGIAGWVRRAEDGVPW